MPIVGPERRAQNADTMLTMHSQYIRETVGDHNAGHRLQVEAVRRKKKSHKLSGARSRCSWGGHN